jgi:hypothetical protein
LAPFSEFHIIAMFVNQCIFNTERAVPVVGAFNGNLRLFGPART